MTWYRLTVKGEGPTPRCFHTTTLVGSKLYVFGGSSDAHYFNDLFVFDARTSTFPTGLAWAPFSSLIHFYSLQFIIYLSFNILLITIIRYY